MKLFVRQAMKQSSTDLIREIRITVFLEYISIEQDLASRSSKKSGVKELVSKGNLILSKYYRCSLFNKMAINEFLQMEMVQLRIYSRTPNIPI